MHGFVKSLLIAASSVALMACSGGGGSTGATTPVNTDRTNPTISFSPANLTVEGRATGSSTLTASDNVGVTSTNVTCTNGGTFANNTFTAPDVDNEVTSTCTATARDAAGNSATATLTVTVPPGPDVSAPTLSFTVPSTMVEAGATTELTVNADDNRGVPMVDVSCDNGGTWANGVFTAPTVTEETIVTCTVTVTDDAGNEVTDTVSFTVTVPDTTPPTGSFSPATLTLDSATTADVVLTASDDVGVASTNVVCDNGGSWANDVYTAPTTTADLVDVCTATITDAAGNEVMVSFTANVTGVAVPDKVTITGLVRFELVPLDTVSNGLDYDATRPEPARAVTIQALDASDTVLVSGVTNSAGRYSLQVDSNTDVRIRAVAEMVSTTGAQWDVKVVDDVGVANADVVYAIQGPISSSGVTNSARNLLARSGWGGTSYTGQRAAAPFAILDSIYQAMFKFAEIDPDIIFPPLLVDWGPTNNGGSFYSNSRIEITGAENDDTDEYDDHVVVHEWGHYFEDNLSRSDSIGGQHSLGNRLDPRVAFGEGYGNALSGIILDDPFYRDSSNSQQSTGFSINVESNGNVPAGWYNEGSVQSILYDIYDSENDGSDNISLGLEPIYNVLVNPDYTGSDYFTTIFLFADRFKAINAGTSAGIDALLNGQSINGTGENGAGETNDGNVGSVSDVLPIYKTLTSGGVLNICSVDNAGDYNKLGIRTFIEFTPPATRSYDLSMVKTSGAAGRDPDFFIYRAGTFIAEATTDSSTSQREDRTITLQGGTKYIIEAFDWQNVGAAFGATTTPSDSCYNFTAN